MIAGRSFIQSLNHMHSFDTSSGPIGPDNRHQYGHHHHRRRHRHSHSPSFSGDSSPFKLVQLSNNDTLSELATGTASAFRKPSSMRVKRTIKIAFRRKATDDILEWHPPLRLMQKIHKSNIQMNRLFSSPFFLSFAFCRHHPTGNDGNAWHLTKH